MIKREAARHQFNADFSRRKDFVWSLARRDKLWPSGFNPLYQVIQETHLLPALPFAFFLAEIHPSMATKTNGCLLSLLVINNSRQSLSLPQPWNLA